MKKHLMTKSKEFNIFLAFFVTAIFIVILHLLFHPVRVLGMDTSIFYMDEKYTLAAFFSTVTAFLVGFLNLTKVENVKNKTKRFVNTIYGLFFLTLAFDEYFEVHEYTNTLIKSSLQAEGVFKTLSNLSWIFPLSFLIFAVFGMFFVKIIWADKKVKLPIFLGILSFFVVIIFELLGSMTYGRDIYVYFVAIEEGLEMIGVSFFLLATLIEVRK